MRNLRVCAAEKLRRKGGKGLYAGGAFLVLFLVLGGVCTVFAADVILNEYNAVDNGVYLNGGNASADDDGGRASDSWFGRVPTNGGDWFEMVVITDHLNMQNWKLDIYEGGLFSETLLLTNHSIWSDLRSGTIITVSEDVPSDISYNPAGGDWWINVQANSGASGAYITASNFAVSKSNWQLRIRNAVGTVIYGPAGEGVAPASGIGGTEVFKLKADPNASITPTSSDECGKPLYGDGKDFSTFGAPNRWGKQDFNLLRSVVAQPLSSLTLTSPNGPNTIQGGTVWPITWDTNGTITDVTIEVSTDNGKNWTAVFPDNAGNSGSYDWQVPMVDSEQCLIRVVNTADLTIFDTSDAVFTIYQCPLEGDLDADCAVDFYDFAILASEWLQSL